MFSSELHLESFKSDSRTSLSFNKSSRDFHSLAFDQQSQLLSQMLFERARTLYNEDKATQLVEMLNDLEPEDLYDIVDIMQDDAVLRNWIKEFEASAIHKF